MADFAKPLLCAGRFISTKINFKTMKAEKIEIGKFYYYGNCKKKWRCVKLNTSKDGSQSDFVDYKNNKAQFYNNDMHIDKAL
jgi:hypothetical protein